ncbi:RNA-binding domain-containing protein [Aeromicrobium sp. CF3.5]|uniref:RNA-binding domain-containing protein n=1 Tax=Aeromicrobium sp. CF3.5 TaxID=3373078 RepID=UPI003EE503C5
MESVNADELATIIADGETFTVEFKRAARANDLSDEDIVEAVICLANGSGGLLLLGVEDDGQVTGVAPRHATSTDPHRLAAMVLNKTEPAVAVAAEIAELDEHAVVVIDVPDVAMPVGTKSGKYVRRSTRVDGRPECVAFPLHEMLSIGLAADGRDYAGTLARGATVDDLDPDEFNRFRRMCASGKGDRGLADSSDLEILRALRLIRPELAGQLTLGAVLLFGTPAALDRFVPTAEATFQVLDRGRITANEVIRAPLFATAEALYERVSTRNPEQEVVVGLHRVGVPRVPAVTLRESIANALVHRDYSERGPVQVQLGSETFRVASPGGFPPGITLDNLLDDSRPRSVILSEAFKRAGIVDRAGRGIAEIFQSQLRAGRGEPDYSTSNDRMVIVVVPTADADLDLVRFVLDYEEDTQDVLVLGQLRILYELKALGPQSVGDLVDTLRLPEGVVRAHLARLAEAGLLEPRGSGRNKRHHLAAAFYRLARSSDYVRVIDTDPIQQEHMILAYVDRFETITRRKAAELCRLSPTQARVVLKRLVERGDLRLVGQRRGAHYVAAREQ